MHGTSDTANTPEGYIAELAEPRRGQIQRLHDLIRRAAPRLEPHIDMGMIGYGTMHYVYASGREGDCSVIGLANNKRSISLYFNAQAPGGGYLAEAYKDRLPAADVGKGCVRFTQLDRVDETVLREMVRAASKFKLDPHA